MDVSPTLIVAVVILISATVTGTLSWRSIKQTETAMKRQAKIDSMRLLADLDTILKEERFRVVEDYLYGKTKTKPDDDILVRYLNKLDKYAIYWEEGLLTTRHVAETYRNLFVRIREDHYIQEFMTKKSQEYKRKLYLPLRNLYNEF